MFAALVLGLLGVGDDDIIGDYALTAEVIERIHALRGESADPVFRERALQVGDDLRNAFPESMAATLERVRRAWGDWEGYASAVGIESAVIEQLRSRLLG